MVGIRFCMVVAYTAINNITFEQNEELDKKFIIENFKEYNTNNNNSSLEDKSKLLAAKEKSVNSTCEGKLSVIDSKCKKHKYQSVCTAYDWYD